MDNARSTPLEGQALAPVEPSGPLRDVPIDWEALEDAFENNAPEVHSYLQLATGEVIRVFDRELALARLTSGSLTRVRSLDRLRVLGEPQRLRALPLLRLGAPAPGRASILFACDDVALDSSCAAHGYRTDLVAGHSFRLVRSRESSSPAPWPDTLLIRLFDEAADEEIALERGELDAAVFWPGALNLNPNSLKYVS